MNAPGSVPSTDRAVTSTAAATTRSRGNVVNSEPDHLAMSDEMHAAAASNLLGEHALNPKEQHQSTTSNKAAKALAKELDEQDRQAKQQQLAKRKKSDAPGVSIVHHDRKPFPHEKFGVDATGHRHHERQPFPHEKFRGHHRGRCDPPPVLPTTSEPNVADYNYDRDEDNEDEEDPPQDDEETGNTASRGNAANLVEAILVDEDNHGINGNNNVASGNIVVDTNAIPNAEIVSPEDASLWARCIPSTTGSKLFCFGILLLLAGVTSVGIVCGSGVCTSSGAQKELASQNGDPPTAAIPSANSSEEPSSTLAQIPTVLTLSPTDETPSPTVPSTPAKPTSSPFTTRPTSSPTSPAPTQSPTTVKPTLPPQTSRPITIPIAAAPTPSPTTAEPTSSPTSPAPTQSPTTVKPTLPPQTSKPTTMPITSAPTPSPTTAEPTSPPTTAMPTISPTTSRPVVESVAAFGRTWDVAATTSIEMWKQQLTGTIPAELMFLTALTGIYLYENQLTGTIPSELGMLTALTSLRLHLNQLGGSVPSEIGRLTELRGLGLSMNNFTGIIPSGLGMLTALTFLALSYNEFTGIVPSELGLLTALMHLNLENNQLTGTVPSELAMMTEIVELDLEKNQITGTVPSELGNLTDYIWLYGEH